MKSLKIGLFFLFSLFLGMNVFQVSFAQETQETPANECRGIKLNTEVPFIGKNRCIGFGNAEGQTNQMNAFPKLMGGMMKLIMTIIMVMSLLMIVAAGVLMTTGGASQENYKKGILIIKKVAIGIALLGASGVILKLINPNFFV